jgi:drug/metabolite transporter superfamily protein YnfA
MTKNLGSFDRIARIVLGITFGILYFTGVTTGTLGIVLAVLGGIFIATSLISWCPIYAVLGIRTCPAK